MKSLSSWLPKQWPKCIVMIEQLTEEQVSQKNRELQPIGTGFVVVYKNLNVLVTCRHIAECRNIAITSNTQQPHQLIIKEISQLSKANLHFVFHPDSNVDIAVIPFPFKAGEEDILRIPLTLFEDFKNISEGDDVFFLGFPLGITTQKRITPLVRSGIVSLKKEDHTFLIDANVFPGNSGSPVFLRPSIVDWKTLSIGKIKPPKLIGIVSSSLLWGKYKESASLAQVCSTKLIMEVLESTEFQTLFERLASRRKSLHSKVEKT